jgi:hypothetical protein
MRNLVRLSLDKSFKYPQYPGMGRGAQKKVYDDETEDQIVEWYRLHGRDVGTITPESLVRDMAHQVAAASSSQSSAS